MFTSPVFQLQVGSHSSAVRHLGPKLEQQEADVNLVGDDLSQLIDEVRGENFSSVDQSKSQSGV